MRIKWAIIPAFLAVAVFLASEDSRGQGRGGFDPNRIFDDLAQKSGGTETIDFGRLPPDTKERMNRMAKFTGGQPLPETGTMSRQQFTDHMARNMEAAKARGFGGPPGGDRGGFGGGDRGGFGGGPPGGVMATPGSSNPDDDAMRRFKERDRNGDGKLSMDEASSTLRGSFAQYDRNGDGLIDIEEYKPYMAQFQFGRGGSSQGGGFNGGPPPSSGPSGGPPPGGNVPPPPPPPPGGDNRDNRDGRSRSDRGEEDAPKPVVYRFGKLPKEVPSFFEKYDDDQDGQLGLYEWRRHNEPTAKFAEMDLNTDGYLTADEWIRFSKQQLEKKPVAYDDDGNPIPVDSPSPRGGGSQYGRSSGGGDRPSGGNPFANNGGGDPRGGPSRGGPPSRDDKDKEKIKDEKNKDDKSKDDRRKGFGPPSGK